MLVIFILTFIKLAKGSSYSVHQLQLLVDFM